MTTVRPQTPRTAPRSRATAPDPANQRLTATATASGDTGRRPTRPPPQQRRRRRQRRLQPPPRSTATTTTVTTVPPENPEQFGPPTLSAGSTISTVGLDTVHFGMTVAEAQRAAGTVLVPGGPTGPCYHVVPRDAPEGIVFLVHEGTIERVDINSGPITTRSGVGVGSPESLVAEQVRRRDREAGANRRDRRSGLRSQGSG